MGEPERIGWLRNPATRRIERSMELAELASVEQNPAKLLKLLKELNALLAKENFLSSSLADQPESNDSEVPES